MNTPKLSVGQIFGIGANTAIAAGCGEIKNESAIIYKDTLKVVCSNYLE